MRVRYYADDDVVELTASDFEVGSGGTLRDDFRVILTFAREGSDDVSQIDILDVSRFLPLSVERGYDADTDTLSLGDKPNSNFRVVDNGEFVSYLQLFDDGSEWDVVALDLRHASKHLAQAIAALPTDKLFVGEGLAPD